MSKYIVDFQLKENLCCCNRKEFDKFDDMFSFVTYWLKRPDVVKFEIQKEELESDAEDE